MDFETDPAAEFLDRERQELGDLENEINATNGKFPKLSFVFAHQKFFFCFPAEPSGEALSSDDFEMINNEISADGAENDGKGNNLLMISSYSQFSTFQISLG